MSRFVMGWGIRILIVAVIGGGAFIFRDRLSSNAAELKVGDCFDSPAVATEIKDVQHHPCTEAHNAEVVFVGNMTGADDAYPGDPLVESWVRTNCVPAWSTYTGKNFETDTALDIGFYLPTTDGWKHGDRGITCYADRVDRASMTSSVRVAN
jgi:hypothetical protein